MLETATGTTCQACGAYMSSDARPFHNCLTFRRRQTRPPWNGVTILNGHRYVSQMDARGNMADQPGLGWAA